MLVYISIKMSTYGHLRDMSQQNESNHIICAIANSCGVALAILRVPEFLAITVDSIIEEVPPSSTVLIAVDLYRVVHFLLLKYREVRKVSNYPLST